MCFALYWSPLSLIARFHQAVYVYHLFFVLSVYDPVVEFVLSATYSEQFGPWCPKFSALMSLSGGVT
jgi:hypothetical protein